MTCHPTNRRLLPWVFVRVLTLATLALLLTGGAFDTAEASDEATPAVPLWSADMSVVAPADLAAEDFVLP